MFREPNRRRLLAAFALMAGAPSSLRAQSTPPCEKRIELGGGAYMVAEIGTLDIQASGAYRMPIPAAAMKASGFSSGLPGDGELSIRFALENGEIVVHNLMLDVPFPTTAFGFERTPILVDGKAFGTPDITTDSSRAAQSAGFAHLTAAQRKPSDAALKAGTTVQATLRETPVSATVPGAAVIVSVRTPDIRAQLPALRAAMVKLNEEQAANACLPLGGDCFLTTAAVHTVGLADDCWELRTLRAFRDGPLQALPGGAALAADYYDRAPGIVRAIGDRPDAGAVWLKTYWSGIVPCAVAAKLGLTRLALALYRRMTLRLERLASGASA